LLTAILEETHYDAWLLSQTRGEQRRSNVEHLIDLTRQFDFYRREGLFRFLKFVEAQQEADIQIEPTGGASENAVRLMSIHQSKGLEFPVVVVADLGKRFNQSDANTAVMLDEFCGLCPQIRSAQTGRRYPSLPFWVARRRQRQELVGEEMRLLYVAMTRAQERLILAGSAKGDKALQKAERAPTVQNILDSPNMLAWLGMWLNSVQPGAFSRSGDAGLLSVQIYEKPELSISSSLSTSAQEASPSVGELTRLRERIEWPYPYREATKVRAKRSVSELRRQANDEADEDAAPAKWNDRPFRKRKASQTTALTAAQVGTAHHRFLECVGLERVTTCESLALEAERLRAESVLTAEEVAALDLAAVAAFWQSSAGQQILTHRTGNSIRREMPFTARFDPKELELTPLDTVTVVPIEEFVVVQGVIDLAVLLPDEVWLVDFKTDVLTLGDVEEKRRWYQPQLALYAEALQRTFNRPVTRRWLHFLSLRQTVAI
jgi:ATP-dependent helicase/nuclease subunit A